MRSESRYSKINYETSGALSPIYSIFINFYKILYSQWHRKNKYRRLFFLKREETVSQSETKRSEYPRTASNVLYKANPDFAESVCNWKVERQP